MARTTSQQRLSTFGSALPGTAELVCREPKELKHEQRAEPDESGKPHVPVLRCHDRTFDGRDGADAVRASRLKLRGQEYIMYHDFNYEATLASSLRAAW